MTKLYANKKNKNLKKGLGPREETIRFLLNFSRSLHYKKCKSIQCELNLN